MSKRGPKLGRDTQAKKNCFKENKKQKSYHKFSQSQERKTKPFQDNTTHKPVCGIKASFVTRIYIIFVRSFGEPVSIQKTLTPALSS